MAIPQQTKPAQQTVTEEQRTEFQKLLEKDLKLMEYIPFQGDQPIKLTPKIVLEYLAIPTKSGKWPTERDCLRFMMLCRARKLNPFEGDAWLLGYDTQDGPKFELITAHAALMKRAEANTNYDGMESGIVYTPSDPCKLCDAKGFVPKGNDLRECPRCHGSGNCDEIKGSLVPAEKRLVGGWAVIRFKEKGTPQYDRVQLSAYQKGFGRWKDDSAGQIQKVAEASVARLSFPNTLGALYLREELETSPEKITGNAPPVFDMPATEPPKSSGTNGMKPTAGEEDEVPFDSLPKKKPSEGKTTEEVLAFLKMCMHESGVSEDQIIGHCKIVGMASAKIEELPQLADSKLRTLADEWDTRLPDIQGVVI